MGHSYRSVAHYICKTLLALTLFTTSVIAHAITFECTRPDDVLRYRLVPGCEGRHYSDTYGALKFSINKAGLVMGADPIPIPAKNSYRILILGTSYTANINDEVGLDQTLIEELNKKKLKNGRGQTMKFEVVNASIPGYSLIQLHIILPSLIEAYHPHLIVLDQYYPSRLVSLLFDHDSAEEIDQETGLVKKLGVEQDLWPLPRSLNYLLWRLDIDTAQRIRFGIKAFRMAAFKARIHLKTLLSPHEPSPYVRTHLKYLSAIARIAQTHEVPLVLMHWIPSDFSIDDFVKTALEKDLWFDIEIRMLKIPPYGLIRRQDIVFQDEQIKKMFRFIDLSKLRFSAGELLDNDLHLALPGFKKVAGAIAEQLIPLVKSDLEPKRPPAKARRANEPVGLQGVSGSQ